MISELKVGCLIPIRLSSERLPGKALMDICGKPVVHHLLDRVFACKNITNNKNVIVCTTIDSTDDILEIAVKEYGASVFRGSTNDIIDRFYNAAKAHDLDIILQVDGDDPLCETAYMDLCLAELKNDLDTDVISCTGLPIGIAPKAFTRRAMKVVYERYQTTQNDTGFAYYFTKTGFFKTKEIKPVSSLHIHKTARLTLDYDVDLQFFRAVFNEIYSENSIFSLPDIIALLNSRDDILNINAGLDEKYMQRTIEKANLDYIDQSGASHQIDIS